jgi:DsbC/DsbD-like thiol-disulfide interchange protein
MSTAWQSFYRTFRTRLTRLTRLTCLMAITASAESPLDIQLISEARAIAPGESFYMGLALKHGAHYHSYWKHPGIVGVPTSIAWENLPAGFKAEPIDWPAPEHVLMFTIHAQGYERDVVLPIKITPPADLKPGSRITLSGAATWMVCAQQCNPGHAVLSISLPVGAKSERDDAWHTKITAELARRPQVSDAWRATVASDATHYTLTLEPTRSAAKIIDAKEIRYFTEDGLIDSDKPQHLQLQPNGTLTLRLHKVDYIVGDAPTELRGVLLGPPSWHYRETIECLRVVVSLPKQ